MDKKKYLLSLMLAGSFANANISGLVFKDFNNDGVFNDKDSVAPAVPIIAVCDDGKSYTQNTKVDGTYNLVIPNSVKKCRVEAKADAIGMGDGMNSSAGAPLVDFVTNGTSSHDISLGSAASYCQENPDVVMATMPGYFTKGEYWAGGGESPFGHNLGSVFKVPAPQNGTFNDDTTIDKKRVLLAKVDDTGAIWGAAFQRSTKTLFVSSALKRYTPLKDESSATAVKKSAGTIYAIDTINGGATPFITIDNVLTDDAANKLSNRDYGFNKDLDVVNYTGRMGLGDLEISEDDKTLYTVNMNTKQLVKIDIATKTQNAIDIPNPYTNGECADDKVRPWALKVRGKDVFIGSVCEDKIEDGVGAAIQKYDGNTFKTIAITNSLRYLRAQGYNPAGGKEGSGYRYQNWSNVDSDAPMLTDIEFTNKGDLVLGYNSRETYNRFSSLKGDIRKMCLNPDGTFTDESSDVVQTNCATHKLTYPNNPTTYYEFYTGDFFGGDHGSSGHPETAAGALAQAPGAPNIIVGMIDATNWYQPGAIGNYDNTSGDKIGAQAVIKNSPYKDGGEREPYAGKAGGMGDVELLCDPSPIEIGDLVWVDVNKNGIQDANEPSYPNVPVKLQCKENGSYVDYGTTTTDIKGHFYFGGINNANLKDGKSLKANLECKLNIAKSDVNNKPATIANPNNDANDTIDNDAKEVGDNNVIEFKLSNANNHNLDFGIEPTVGCLVGVLYEDVNNNGEQDSTDKTAPAGITIIAKDMFGNSYTTETNSNGEYSFDAIPAGDVTISVDITDTDIPENAVWKNKTLSGKVTEGTPPNCLEEKFPFTLPSPTEFDPKDIALCAEPTSLTWDGSEKSTSTKWTGIGDEDLIDVETAGGKTVEVSMHVENPDNQLNNDDSGTSAAFGEPYLTLYLGNQDNPGDGDYLNSDGKGCKAHGYELEAGQKIKLIVDFNESVVLDNWRIRDVDSGDVRNNESNWEWQDGIKVEAFDKDGNPVEVETKLADSAVGLIKDNNGIIHTDKDNYDAGGGDFATGQGTSPNASNGHIVLTSNFKPIKKLIITHQAGPDMPCQTRSALALSGFAVCKPLHISGTVYEDKDGIKNPQTCSQEDSSELKNNNKPISKPDGVQLNACLIDANNKVLASMPLDDNGHYDFFNGIEPNKDYQVIITTNNCTIGAEAPIAKLPKNWVFEGEKQPGYGSSASDCEANVDGSVKFNVGSSSKEVIDFAINKIPTAKDYFRESELNEDKNFTFVKNCNAPGDFIDDKASNPEHWQTSRNNLKIRIESINNGDIYLNGTKLNVGDEITNPDFCALEVDPKDGDAVSTFEYVAIDEAGRESNKAIFEAPFTTINLSGNVFKDMQRDDNVNGTPTSKACDGTTNLYAILLDKQGNKLSSTQILEDGTYIFYYEDGIRALEDYRVVLTDNPDSTTPHLPNRCWNLDGENVNSITPSGNDGKPDGKIDVHTQKEDLTDVDLAITPTVKIGDRLWYEDDYDGDATTGNIKPVVGNVVTAKCGNKEYNATTDENGIYEIELPANIGECEVFTPVPEKAAPTYGSDDSDVTDNISENNKNHNPKGTLVKVGTQDNMTLDFGFIQELCLGDRVWEDTNANGIQDDGESGIANVRVNLMMKDSNGKWVKAKDVKGNPIDANSTDSNGNYKFCHLQPAIDYKIIFTKPNGYYVTDKDVDNNSKDANDSDIDENSEIIVKKPVVDNYTLDAGFFKPACIGDKVWIDSNANGIQDKGELGLDGVKVELMQNGSSNIVDVDGNAIAPITTANGGKYHFECKLKPGKYSLKFTTPNGYYFTRADVNSTDDSKDSDVKEEFKAKVGTTKVTELISGQDDRSWDVGVFKPACIGDIIWEDKNANGVQDEGEVAPKDENNNTIAINVSLDVISGGLDRDLDGNALSKTIADDGTYKFCKLVPGEYQVKVNVPKDLYVTRDNIGNDDSKDSDIKEFLDTEKVVSMPKEILSSGEDNTTFDGGLFKAACVGSFVWDDRNSNGIKDEGERGIAGVKVTLLPYQDEFGFENNITVTKEPLPNTETDENGTYQFCGLIPGSYRLMFEAPRDENGNIRFTTGQNQGDDSSDSDAQEYKDGKVYTAPITLSSGANNPTVFAGYVSEICLGDFVWYDKNLNGIQDKGEPGVIDVGVKLTTLDGSEVIDVNGNVIKPTKTNKQGKYSFCHLKPGVGYKIKFDVPDTYHPTLQKQGRDEKLNSDANDNGEIIINKATKDDYSNDLGIYCDCDDYKVHPNNYKELKAPAVSLFGFALMITALIILARSKEN